MKILIAGLPKTGTTALLHLLAKSLGGRPQLLFEPTECPDDRGAGRCDVVAKVLIAPGLKARSFAHFDRKITITRDPRDRLVSDLLYRQFEESYLSDDRRVSMVRTILEQKERCPSGLSIRDILGELGGVTGRPNYVAGFQASQRIALGLFDRYVADMPDCFFYRYEDFVSLDYAALSHYLRVPLTGKAEVPGAFSRVTRTKTRGDWRNWFTERDVQDLRPLLSPWLAKYGYAADDWALDAAPSIDARHCSGYFMRLVKEFREAGAASAAQAPKSAAKTLTGMILRAETTIVAGWAIGADPGNPVRVALRVNGREVGQTVADRPRPRQKESGVHPTGLCGFVFRFDGDSCLNPGDQVAVVPVGVDFVVLDSPRLVTTAAPARM